MTFKKNFKSFPDEHTNIGIDFDGVIHRCTKGFHDGTIYDLPVDGAFSALEVLSKKYNIIIYSAKARKDRPLVDNKTGEELIWEWLHKNNMSQFVKDVTAEKPRALFYVDDRAYRFKSWEDFFSIEEVKKIL